MIDWNRNGKVDPVDIGISIALNESEEYPNEAESKNISLPLKYSKEESGFIGRIKRKLFKK